MPHFDWKKRPEVSQYLESVVSSHRAGLEEGQQTLWKRDLAPAFIAEFPDFCVGESIDIVAGRLRQRWISMEKERTESELTRQELLDTVKELRKDNKDLHERLLKYKNKRRDDRSNYVKLTNLLSLARNGEALSKRTVNKLNDELMDAHKIIEKLPVILNLQHELKKATPDE